MGAVLGGRGLSNPIKPVTQHAQLHCLSDILRRIANETTIPADGDVDLRQTSRPEPNHIIALGSNTR
jgi:hypothetical protein